MRGTLIKRLAGVTPEVNLTEYFCLVHLLSAHYTALLCLEFQGRRHQLS